MTPLWVDFAERYSISGYTITMPEEDDFYAVREDQLDSIASGGKSIALELAIFCGGVSLGFIPNFLGICKNIYEAKALVANDYIIGGLFIGLLVLGVAKFIEHRKTRTNIDTLVTKIKTGQKLKVNSSAKS